MRRYLLNAFLVLNIMVGFLQAATVSGVVTDSVSGSKLDSVRVRLMSGNTTVATDTTNAEGAYSFGTVDTGRYTIRISKTNYVSKSVFDTISTGETEVVINITLVAIVRITVSGTVTDSAGATALKGVIVQLSSTGAAPLVDTTGDDGKYSFADVQTGNYTARASLADYVTKSLAVAVAGSAAVTIDIPMVKIVRTTVSGTVTDSAAVTVLKGVIVQIQSTGGGVPSRTDTTGDDGKYSFADVQTGNYSVRASMVDYVTKSLAAAVNSTAAVTVDIPLVKTIKATVSGTVTDSAAGIPLANAVVRLRLSGTSSLRDTTGADGAFSFADVATGTYTLQASLDGYTGKTIDAAVTSATFTATIALAKVVVATVSGTVTDSAADTALAGAIVRLQSGATGGNTMLDTTGSDGKFSFANVAVGDYTVRAALADYTTKSVAAAVTGTAAVTADVALVKVVTASVSGSVTDSAAGTKLAGVIVQLRSGTGGGTTIASDTSDAEGAYSFPKVAAGSYSVRASAAGYITKTIAAAVTTSDAVTVNVSLVPVTFGAIVGKVTADSLGGAALGGVAIILSRGGAAVDTATTDADGKYSFEKVQTQAAFTLRGSKTGYVTKTANLAVKHDGADTVNFFMAPVVTRDIKVIVLKAADSSALAGASVALTAAGEVQTGTTDASGLVLVKGVVEGSATIAVSAAGFTASTRQFAVSVASADSIRMYLAASSAGTKTLIGTVSDSTTGAKLAGVTVTARVGGGGGITLAATTGADGAYTIVGLPVTASTVTLAASLDNYRTVSRSVVLGTADTADTTKVDVKLLASGLPVTERKMKVAVNGGKPFVDVNACGNITLYNFAGNGMVEMLGLNGKLLHRRAFDGAGSAGVVLQPIPHSNAAIILKVTRSDGAAMSSRVVRLKK